jgi:phosphohistidine phosphatase SixA
MVNFGLGKCLGVFALSIILGATGSVAMAQGSSTDEVLAALRNGGYIIFMRHANAPGELPTSATAAPGNDGLERQLDEKGRNDARNFGDAIRRLGVPVSSIEVSPTFRTRQTAALAGFTAVTIQDFLLEESMVGVTPARLQALKAELARRPASGNRLFISHSGNIMASFPELDPTIEQGEALIVDPSNPGQPLLARVPITRWQTLQ